MFNKIAAFVEAEFRIPKKVFIAIIASVLALGVVLIGIIVSVDLPRSRNHFYYTTTQQSAVSNGLMLARSPCNRRAVLGMSFHQAVAGEYADIACDLFPLGQIMNEAQCSDGSDGRVPRSENCVSVDRLEEREELIVQRIGGLALRGCNAYTSGEMRLVACALGPLVDPELPPGQAEYEHRIVPW